MSDEKYPGVIATPQTGQWTQVQPGVLWLRMPLPFKLDHVNLYLIEDHDGWFLVDSGMAHHSSYAVWPRLVADGLDGKPLKGILVTHYHPDHVGAAGWLAERWQLPLWMTVAEYDAATELQQSQHQDAMTSLLSYYRRAGHDADTCQEMARMQQTFARLYVPLPGDYTPLHEGDRLSIGSQSWRVIVSRGHSPAHACFYNEQRQLLICGDQVLPTISSNVSLRVDQLDDNPLKHWLEGLARLAELPSDTLLLPAHNHPFYGLQARVRELVDGHLAMLEQIVPLLDRPQTVQQMARSLFPQATAGFDLALATGEAWAHLQYLLLAGRVTQSLNPQGQLIFSRVDSSLG